MIVPDHYVSSKTEQNIQSILQNNLILQVRLKVTEAMEQQIHQADQELEMFRQQIKEEQMVCEHWKDIIK